MKPDGILKHLAAVFVLSLAAYLGFFYGLEHYRSHRGPWELTFGVENGGTPYLEVAHPRLKIGNFKLTFAGTNLAARLPETIRFDQPTRTNLPFGRVIFMDTTFLPGTVTLDLFGHEVECLPRVMIVDKHEEAWQPPRTITLSTVESRAARP